ncbi:MAG: hypothetical protein A3J35_06165 [Gammaproteobacteria bacterium RIFCSPLOWO2_02_FULL_52_10]|nr:MAG: hypothetical protein A3J35_06165 [Gammaproteobacteria bacterium RIFCSPLOWO2_02_FULL_52_10]
MAIVYNSEKVRGVLNLSESEKNYQLARILPSKELSFYVEQFWIVRWDLRNKKPHLQENIPHPCVHLVLEKNKSRIVGIVTRKYSYCLQDAGKIFGIKFRPGGFYPFLNSAVAEFTDSNLSMHDVFDDCENFINTVLDENADEAMVNYAEKFLCSKLPAQKDNNIEKINNIIAKIETDRCITKVDNIVTISGINKRTLQRLFYKYVGVSPKWVIKKYRLQEVLEKFENGNVDVQDMIYELGYFDQSHFIRDFKAFIGKSPHMYMDN